MVGIRDYDLREELLFLIAELDAVTRTEFNKNQKANSKPK